MPASVAVYFSKNLAEEQNLLTKKYEFQLFQFKHLYKHLANNEKTYELVCREIDKNLSEFKKCTSYLKLPKCSLLTRSKNSTPVSKGGNTPASQRLSKVAPHVKQLPYLPSPVGSSFSEPSGARVSNKRMPEAVSSRRQMNNGRIPDKKIGRENSQTQNCMPQSQLNMSQISMSQSLHNMSQYQRDAYGSMCSLASSTHTAASPSPYRQRDIASAHAQMKHKTSSQCMPNVRVPASPRPPASQHFNPQARNMQSGGSSRSQHVRPLQRTESMSSSLSMMSTSTNMNDSQSIQSDVSRNRIPGQDPRVNQGRGQDSRLNQGRYAPQQHVLPRSRTPQEMQRRPNGYPLVQKSNSQLLRGEGNTQHRNQNSQGNTMGNMMKRTERMPTDRTQRPTNESGNRIQNDMVDRSGNRCGNQEQLVRCSRGGGGEKKYLTSPFTKYRVKPPPASPVTPLFSRGTQDSCNRSTQDSLTPSSGEQRSGSYRLTSPRTSSSLSSSNSHTRLEVPYKRPPGPGELRTPSQSPRYKQRTPPAPFQETLKILTAAVKQSKINSQ